MISPRRRTAAALTAALLSIATTGPAQAADKKVSDDEPVVAYREPVALAAGGKGEGASSPTAPGTGRPPHRQSAPQGVLVALSGSEGF